MNETKTTRRQRKIYFIDKNFQTKFILKFCALVALGGLFTIGILYLFAMRSTTVSIINSRVVVRTTADFMLPLLIQTVLIVMVIVSLATIWVALLASHKVAGPLYRFKKVLESLKEGDFSGGGFKIRRLDQLQSLADELNTMIEKLREKIKTIKENVFAFKEKLDTITEREVSEEKRSTLSDLKKISEELNKITRYFKI
ncbi:MAG: methyl-accepting chemotaxis protein [Candidatus Omnitrophota bacterium]